MPFVVAGTVSIAGKPMADGRALETEAIYPAGGNA